MSLTSRLKKNNMPQIIKLIWRRIVKIEELIIKYPTGFESAVHMAKEEGITRESCYEEIPT